jgi:hypothetical protein
VLDRLRPPLDLLDLVHDQDAASRVGVQAGRIPLLPQPGGIAQRRLVRADEAHRPLEVVRHLLYQRGLPHLTCTGDDLEMPPRFVEAARQLGSSGASKCAHRSTLRIERTC